METKISSLESENVEYEKILSDLKREQEKVCTIVYICTIISIC